MSNGKIYAKQVSGYDAAGVVLKDTTAQKIEGGKTFFEQPTANQVANFSNTQASRSAGRFVNGQVNVGSGGIYPSLAVFGRQASQFSGTAPAADMVLIGATQDAHLAWFQHSSSMNSDAGYVAVGSVAGGYLSSNTRQLPETRSTWLKCGLSSDYLHMPRFNSDPAALPKVPDTTNVNIMLTQAASALTNAGLSSTKPGLNPLAITWRDSTGVQQSDLLMTQTMTTAGYYRRTEGALINTSGSPQTLSVNKLTLVGTVEVLTFLAYVNNYSAAIYSDPDPAYAAALITPDRYAVIDTTAAPRMDLRGDGLNQDTSPRNWGKVKGGLPSRPADVSCVWRSRRETDEEERNLKGYLDYAAAGLADVPMQEVLFSDRVDGKYAHRYATELGLARWTPSTFYAPSGGNGLFPGNIAVGFAEGVNPPNVWTTPLQVDFDGGQAVMITNLILSATGLSAEATGFIRLQIYSTTPSNQTTFDAGLVADITVNLAERLPSTATNYVEIIGPAGNTSELQATGMLSGPLMVPRTDKGLSLHIRVSSSVDPSAWTNIRLTGSYVHLGGEQRSFLADAQIPNLPVDQSSSTIVDPQTLPTGGQITDPTLDPFA